MRIVVTQNGTRIIKELEYLPKHRSHTIEISNISSKNDDENDLFQNINPKLNNYKEISITNQKLKIPPLMEEKYTITEPSDNKEYDNSQVIPDIFYSINKTIDSNSNYYSSSNGKLPIIRSSFPIKYIIKPEAYKKLQNDIKKQKENLIKKEKKVNDNNFRSQVFEDPKKKFDINTLKEINAENRNLIMYLNNDNTISDKYIEKLNKYNSDRLKKLNKICQSAFQYQEQEKIIRKFIKQKLRSDAIQTSEDYKDKLNEMKINLDKSKEHIKIFPAYSKRERYAAGIKKAEYDWVKFNTARLYKKSKPAITNLYFENDDSN